MHIAACSILHLKALEEHDIDHIVRFDLPEMLQPDLTWIMPNGPS
jgi:hypothetical protein